MYFPLIVKEALMIEPTETESKAELDILAQALIAAAQLADDDPARFKDLPKTMPISRPDEVKAAKDIRCNFFA